jgi:hypothetical protein
MKSKKEKKEKKYKIEYICIKSLMVSKTNQFSNIKSKIFI